MNATPSDSNVSSPAGKRRRWRWGYLVPVAIFLGLALGLGLGLLRDPSRVPSALTDKPVPEFVLPPLSPRTEGLASTDFGDGRVVLVNVFASWCEPCRLEHPLLIKLAQDGTVPIHGINYKDKPEDARAWLDEIGDPYERLGSDLNGRAGIAWGVYGVPETFVVDGQGIIRHKHIGYLTPDVLENTILPLVEELGE